MSAFSKNLDHIKVPKLGSTLLRLAIITCLLSGCKAERVPSPKDPPKIIIPTRDISVHQYVSDITSGKTPFLHVKGLLQEMDVPVSNDLIEKISSSMVLTISKHINFNVENRESYEGITVGSGVFIDKNVIATNLHVAKPLWYNVRESIRNKKSFSLSVPSSYSPQFFVFNMNQQALEISDTFVPPGLNDLCFLICENNNKSHLPLSENPPARGAKVFHMGFGGRTPEGRPVLKGSPGRVSLLNTVDTNIKGSFPLVKRDSGGPILSTDGKIMGLAYGAEIITWGITNSSTRGSSFGVSAKAIRESLGTYLSTKPSAKGDIR